MFVKGARKHISTFCLPENEKKKKKKLRRITTEAGTIQRVIKMIF